MSVVLEAPFPVLDKLYVFMPDGVAAIVMSDRESADADNATVEVLDVLTGEVLN